MLRTPALRVIARRAVAQRAYSVETENTVQTNDSSKKEAHPSVSSTNTLPSHAKGNRDQAVSESVEKGLEMKTWQAPNRAGVWSRSQKPRAQAMVGPRFEQTIVEDQVG